MGETKRKTLEEMGRMAKNGKELKLWVQEEEEKIVIRIKIYKNKL